MCQELVISSSTGMVVRHDALPPETRSIATSTDGAMPFILATEGSALGSREWVPRSHRAPTSGAVEHLQRIGHYPREMAEEAVQRAWKEFLASPRPLEVLSDPIRLRAYFRRMAMNIAARNLKEQSQYVSFPESATGQGESMDLVVTEANAWAFGAPPTRPDEAAEEAERERMRPSFITRVRQALSELSDEDLGLLSTAVQAYDELGERRRRPRGRAHSPQARQRLFQARKRARRALARHGIHGVDPLSWAEMLVPDNAP